MQWKIFQLMDIKNNKIMSHQFKNNKVTNDIIDVTLWPKH